MITAHVPLNLVRVWFHSPKCLIFFTRDNSTNIKISASEVGCIHAEKEGTDDESDDEVCLDSTFKKSTSL